MNEIIKNQVASELVVVDPFDPTKTHGATDIVGMVKDWRGRVEFWRGKVKDIVELGDQPLAVLKATRKQIADDDKALTSYAQKYADGVVEFCGLTDNVRALQVQIKGTGRSVEPTSIRGGFAEVMATLDAAIAAMTPPEPTHTYVVRLTCTDKVLDKTLKAAAKDGATDVLVGAAQSDKAVKQIAKWFAENV